ncbi:MAG TPA: HEPN domain-containing protein [Firmicutes bacterium]|nr:HEPN domain-containing protein [Bacillota bacterium]
MDKAERVKYWLDIAEYDLETANSLLSTGRYLYVMVMCQQALEKLCKALFVDVFGEEPPRTHNLNYILAKVHDGRPEIDPKDKNIAAFLADLSAYYLEGRYPSYKEKLSTLVGCAKAKTTYSKTEEVFAWLKSLLMSIKQ